MLLPLINETFNGTIWRMEIDEISDAICLEIRREEEKKVCFASLSLTTGQVYFKELETPERWFTGIEAVFNGVLLLHNYQSETGPVHKGIVAVDVFTGDILWSNYTFAFDHLTIEGPVVYDTHIQPKKLFLTDVRTGDTRRIYPPSVHRELDNSVVVPELVAPGSLGLQFLKVHPYGNIVHYLEYNNYRIVSLHALKGGLLTQWLYLMNGDDVVYEDVLNTDIQKMQPEAFILHKSRLIYTRNKTELKVLTL